jgi:hypothetical protein
LEADQPFDLLMRLVEPLHDARGTEQLDQGVGLFVVELDDLTRPVGVLAVVDHQVAPAGPMRHDADPLPGLGGEIVAQAYPWQRRLFDLHRRIPTHLDCE